MSRLQHTEVWQQLWLGNATYHCALQEGLQCHPALIALCPRSLRPWRNEVLIAVVFARLTVHLILPRLSDVHGVWRSLCDTVGEQLV